MNTLLWALTLLAGAGEAPGRTHLVAISLQPHRMSPTTASLPPTRCFDPLLHNQAPPQWPACLSRLPRLPRPRRRLHWRLHLPPAGCHWPACTCPLAAATTGAWQATEASLGPSPLLHAPTMPLPIRLSAMAAPVPAAAASLRPEQQNDRLACRCRWPGAAAQPARQVQRQRLWGQGRRRGAGHAGVAGTGRRLGGA